MGTEYIDIYAKQMAEGKTPGCRRAIAKALETVKDRVKQGLYHAQNEPLEDLDSLASHSQACAKHKPALNRPRPSKRNSKYRGK